MNVRDEGGGMRDEEMKKPRIARLFYRSPVTGHLPLKAGLRFSMNAVRPSM